MLYHVHIIVCSVYVVFFFKQKTAYEMRISDWSSDVCSSDLPVTAADAAIALGVDRVLSSGGAAERGASASHSCTPTPAWMSPSDRKSVVSGKSVSVRVDLGGRRISKNNTH